MMTNVSPINLLKVIEWWKQKRIFFEKLHTLHCKILNARGKGLMPLNMFHDPSPSDLDLIKLDHQLLEDII